ncbi:hypothetical protein BDV96DRAFT_524592 [Lophiotrema nucula]|uniref:Uncharacterized protein n=1 Tax=Lophiotrema nucula TaxID=690887 RepID=A0A6A5YZL1_9PLEO|nr:hypothetical protein BDV96DRAFT_524592 [Lophiotrema nucula]
MESSHLTKAHEHVRNAATATYSSSIVSAGAEHELAASAFHDAFQDTHNEEALRILGLLENHHKKLATLIKEPPRKKEKDHGTNAPASDPSTTSPPPSNASARTASPSKSSSPTPAPSRRRLPQSSIASNLAEKRGIPGARRGTASAGPVSVTNALAARNERPSTPVRDLLQRQQKANEGSKKKEESPRTAREDEFATSIVSSPSDDNFKRFYSAFGGVISAISAPLAFTSLPLNPLSSPAQPERPPSPAKKSRSKSPEQARTIKSSEPDLAALISKPALRALREDRSTPLGPFANNESFYVVPTSGGTVSYASILREQQAQERAHHAAQNPHLDSINEGDSETGLKGSSHEEFVDARETVGPPSPTLPRRPRSKGSTSGGVTPARTIAAGRGTGQKTMEELALENETLRGLIDKQAKRLIMWETTSQSSYNALAQSFRARGGIKQQMSDPSALAQALSMGSNVTPALPSPPVPQIPAQYRDDTKSHEEAEKQQQRIAELEAMLATQTSRLGDLETENDSLSKQNQKNSLVIGRYREQWEKLKAGARKKEHERREKRLAEIKSGADAKDSESGDATADGEDAIEGEEPGFGKA